MNEPRPCSAFEAVRRALSIANNGGAYILGTGDYHPLYSAGRLVDRPWTERDGLLGSDCAGFAISWCYKLPRHRPGFNRGSWATVSDDLNCNSAIEDAQHERDLFEVISTPEIGALLAYPTIVITKIENGKPEVLHFIGHVCIVTGTSRVKNWDTHAPRYDQLDVAQCKGPNGRTPAVVTSDGSIWSHHDSQWPKPEHRSWMLRARDLVPANVLASVRPRDVQYQATMAMAA